VGYTLGKRRKNDKNEDLIRILFGVVKSERRIYKGRWGFLS